MPIVSIRIDEAAVDGSGHSDAIPEICPWREVGWIFKEGGALAIERQADRRDVAEDLPQFLVASHDSLRRLAAIATSEAVQVGNVKADGAPTAGPDSA